MTQQLRDLLTKFRTENREPGSRQLFTVEAVKLIVETICQEVEEVLPKESALTAPIKPYDIACGICSGIEGGINYWCRSYRYEATEEQVHAARAATDDTVSCFWKYFLPVYGGTLIFKDDERGGAEYRLDRAALERGIAVIAEKYPHHLGGVVDAGSGDATTGDVLIQCAIFGELVYG